MVEFCLKKDIMKDIGFLAVFVREDEGVYIEKDKG